jgi:hypothetical protein
MHIFPFASLAVHINKWSWPKLFIFWFTMYLAGSAIATSIIFSNFDPRAVAANLPSSDASS